MKKSFRIFALITALLLALAGFTPALADTAATAAWDINEYFTSRDLSGEWDSGSAVAITLNGSGAECSSGAVSVNGGTVTITEEGVYVLSGTLTDGSIVIAADDSAKVQLVLNGVSITSSDTAAILVENADKVFITLAEGTENALANGGSFPEDSNVDAVVFSRDDLTLNGSGSLTVSSPAGNGIVGKDDLKFASGTYVITAEGRGIDANDSVRIADGTFTIVAGKDGIRAKSDDSEKGYVLIFDGVFSITAGGGSANAPAHTSEMMGFGYRASSSNENTASTKGVKASGSLTILGGALQVDAADDAFHTDSDLTVAGGSITVSSGDDGFHADNDLLISGGTIDIVTSYEGIEGKTITVTDGIISLVASDDGFNAAGGNDSSGYGFYDMFASEDGVYIRITGGSIYVNAAGDGIDSNGDLTVTGGTIVVSGPTNSGNGALDKNGSATITGGTVIAAGATGMAENFDSTSTQPAALVSLNGSAGEITVSNSNGNVLFSGTVEKSFQCVVISSPDLTVGETYTVSCNGASTQVTLTGIITGSSGMGGFGGFGGQQGGGFGGFGDFGGQQGGGQQGGGHRGGRG